MFSKVFAKLNFASVLLLRSVMATKSVVSCPVSSTESSEQAVREIFFLVFFLSCNLIFAFQNWISNIISGVD